MKNRVYRNFVLGLVVLCLLSQNAFAGSGKMSLKDATSLLDRGKDSKRLSQAILTVLGSSLAEERKQALLQKLFVDKDRVIPGVEFQEFRDAFKACSTKLQNPNDLLLALAEDDLYRFKEKVDGETYLLHGSFIDAVCAVPKPKAALLRKLLPLCKNLGKGTHLGSVHMPTLARHADDALLKEVFALFKTWSRKNQEGYVPRKICPFRTRPLVFEFLVDSYIKLKYPEFLRECIIGEETITYDERYPAKVPDYGEVKPADAARFIPPIDKLLAAKQQLLQLKDKRARLKARDITRLESIRALMVKKVESLKKN